MYVPAPPARLKRRLGHFEERPGTTNSHQFDGQGSTRLLTDASDVIPHTVMYTAFGEVVSATGATVNPSSYKGGAMI